MGDVLDEDSRRKICKAKAGRVTFARRFLRDRRGSTAIEFAMLALPFAALVFAILESCVSFAGQEVMANITDDIARQLRTGQLRQADVTEEKLKGLVCARLEIIVAKGCPGLLVDLRPFKTFAGAASAGFTISGSTITLTGKDPDTGKDPAFGTPTIGPAESKNMLRVFYPWPVMTDFMAQYMSNMDGGKTLHYATTTWQNEPFDN
ncbi:MULTISPECIES: TadE/TadG family type IV pilus assembly protein [unclassified Mesorhizobium]|uniref:TadE/TadG family type IV pilus assembly protein n=1 Tax=unclassified Mesorhizobium TaxID=325217 RepID=UPI00041BF397|nr:MULTISPECIES: TadE/TadG family type IV pilus assembly protein [unclassified Mesorhizobium]WJI74566.1 pilus assembly protein [Mesorhizobium sp. C395A]